MIIIKLSSLVNSDPNERPREGEGRNGTASSNNGTPPSTVSQQAQLIEQPTVVPIGPMRDNRGYTTDTVSETGEGAVAPSVHSSVMDQRQVCFVSLIYIWA